MTPLRSLSTLSVLLLCTPALAHTQSCFRGRPLPTCRTFWVTESGIAKRLNHNPYGASDDILATAELGLMRNRSDRTALGATAVFALGDQLTGSTDVMFGVKARYRRWLSPTTSVEVAPGALFVPERRKVALTAHAAFNLSDYAAVTAQVLGGGNDVGVYVGVKAGSYPGVVGAIAAPLVVLGLFLLVPMGD
jgi:hypothetical protein